MAVLNRNDSEVAKQMAVWGLRVVPNITHVN